MKKMIRNLAWLLLSLLLCVHAAMAEEAPDPIDLGRQIDLSIVYEDEDTPLRQVTFRLYRIATVSENGVPTLVAPFSTYPVSLEGQDADQWSALASTLEAYVLRDNIPATASGKTNGSGRMRMSLALGYYLVLGERHVQDGLVYEVLPAIVLLPTKSPVTGAWVYEAVLYPKFDSAVAPGENDFIRRKVLKVWDDEGHEHKRPAKVTVHLLRDGEVFDTVELTAQNNWRHTWEQLDARYTWRVIEEIPEGYTVEISREGITFVVRNTMDGPGDTPTDPPDDPDLPQTGQLWWPVPILIAGGLLLLVIGMLRRRSEWYEG